MKLFRPPKHFETSRILARPLCAADAPDVFHYLLSDPRVTWHLPLATHFSVEETIAYIRLCELGWRAGFFHIWGLVDKASGRIIGLVEMRAALPRVEFGVITTQQPDLKRRRALAMMTGHILEWLITQSHVYRIYACCDPHSEASRAVEHLGFRYEAQLTGWEARPNQNKPAGTINTYVLLRPFDSWLNTPLRAQLLKKEGMTEKNSLPHASTLP